MLILVERCGTAQCITVGCIIRRPAHGDPCPPPQAGTWASELDQGAMDQGDLVCWIPFLHVCRLSGERTAPECTTNRTAAGRGNLLPGNLWGSHSLDATLDVRPTRWCRWWTFSRLEYGSWPTKQKWIRNSLRMGRFGLQIQEISAHQASVGCAGQTGSIHNGVHVSMGQGCPGRWSPCYSLVSIIDGFNKINIINCT